MKLKSVILALAAAAAAMLPREAGADIVLAISPEIQRTDTAMNVLLGVEKNVVPTLASGETLTVMDGATLKVVTTMTIPDDPRLDENPAVKIRLLRRELADLKSWLGTKREEDAMSYTLDIPGIFEKCAAYTDLGSKGGKLMLVGSMVFHDPVNEAFTMRGGRVPSDGHIRSPYRDTPFGLQGAEGRLKGVEVHWNELGLHGTQAVVREGIHRFWSIWVKAQAAELVQIDNDTAQLFRTLHGDHRQPHRVAVADPNAPVVMLKPGAQSVEVVAAVEEKPAAPAKVVAFVVDATRSMIALRHKVSDEIAKRPIADNTTYMLFTFYDYDREDQSVPVARLLGESQDPKDLGPMLRSTPFLQGRTEPEACNEGLLCVRDTLAPRGLKATAVEVYSDDRPHEAAEQPITRPDFRRVVREMSAEGTTFRYFWMSASEPRWSPPAEVELERLR